MEAHGPCPLGLWHEDTAHCVRPVLWILDRLLKLSTTDGVGRQLTTTHGRRMRFLADQVAQTLASRLRADPIEEDSGVGRWHGLLRDVARKDPAIPEGGFRSKFTGCGK